MAVDYYVREGIAAGTRKAQLTALRHFNDFQRSRPGTASFVRAGFSDHRASLAHNERTMMLFAMHLVHKTNAAAATICAYCSHVRSHVATVMDIRIPTDTARWKKLVRAIKRKHSVPSAPKAALRITHLRAAYAGRWDVVSQQAVNEWALICVGLRTLARPSELIHLNRSHLQFVAGTPPHAVVWLTPLKKQPGHQSMPIPIAVGDQSGADAFWALMRLVCIDPVAPAFRGITPLFRRRNGARFNLAQITALVRAVARAAGENAALAHFSGRSLRVGGATELAARGAPPAVIQQLGRWDSNAYQAYTRLTRDRALHVADAFGFDM